MSKTESSLNQIITRRGFLHDSARALTAISLLNSPPAAGRQKVSPNTDYSSVIEKIKQTLPVAMALKDITGASIALVDGENIIWSEGFGYTDRSQKVKVTGDTLFHAGSISKSFTARCCLRAGLRRALDCFRLSKFMTPDDEWRGVPPDRDAEWQAVFRLSREVLDLCDAGRHAASPSQARSPYCNSAPCGAILR